MCLFRSHRIFSALRYPVAEFRALVERQVKALGSKQVEALKRVRHVEITLANLQDTLQELEESLRVETGALMQVRCCCCSCRLVLRLLYCCYCRCDCTPTVSLLLLLVLTSETAYLCCKFIPWLYLNAFLKLLFSPPSQRAVKRARLIRCLVPNLSNALANDVTGAASGGVKLFAAAMGTHANVYDIETGCLMQVGLRKRVN